MLHAAFALRLFALSVVIFLLSSVLAFAQCGDGGVCSISSYGGHDALVGMKSTRYRVGIQYGYSMGPAVKEPPFESFDRTQESNGVTYNNVSGLVAIDFTNGLSMSLEVPLAFQSGTLGSTSGLGDIFASVSVPLPEFGEFASRLTVGTRLATADANAAPLLPLAYQPGLGSNDLIMAVNGTFNKDWQIALGYQMSRQRSANTYDRLLRGDDLMGTVGWRYSGLGWSVVPMVIAIHRVQEASISLSPASSEFGVVAGSNQTQVNLAARFELDAFGDSRILAELARPIRQRPINYDGLTRSFSASITYMVAL